MNDNKMKTISTVAVWIATAVIFIFGVFSFHWTGDFAGILWAVVAVALAYATVQATRVIWKYPPSERPGETPPGEKQKA